VPHATKSIPTDKAVKISILNMNLLILLVIIIYPFSDDILYDFYK